jgi:hypothetical protein
MIGLDLSESQAARKILFPMEGGLWPARGLSPAFAINRNFN